MDQNNKNSSQENKTFHPELDSLIDVPIAGETNPNPNSNPSLNPDPNPISNTNTTPTQEASTNPNFPTQPQNKSKKKGKLVATILGILILTGGVAFGVYLSQQSQEIREKAASDYCDNSSVTAAVCRGKRVGEVVSYDWSEPAKCKPSRPTCSGNQKVGLVCERTTGTYCAANCKCVTPTTPSQTKNWPPIGAACHSTGGQPGKIGGCVVYYCPEGCSGGCGEKDPGVYWEFKSSCSDDLLGNYCGQIDTVDENKRYCIPNESYYKDSLINCIKPPTKTPEPTPSPKPIARCSSISVYDSTWNLIKNPNEQTFSPGTNINICVLGNTNSGSFEKARFTINGVLQKETTNKNPKNANEFCQNYTIPTGVNKVSVSAEMHHSELGWVK